MSTTIPEPWRGLLTQRGISSIRGLSRVSGLSVEATRRVLQGKSTPKVETIRALAQGLNVPVSEIERRLGTQEPSDLPPYVPPSESARLDQRQREAVDELIRLLAFGSQHSITDSHGENGDDEIEEVDSSADIDFEQPRDPTYEYQDEYDLVADDADGYSHEDEDELREMEP